MIFRQLFDTISSTYTYLIASRKEGEALIIAPVLEKTDHYIHIAISPPKSHDRTEWFVEKAVELGIQEISFVFTNYSERNNIKLNRI